MYGGTARTSTDLMGLPITYVGTFDTKVGFLRPNPLPDCFIQNNQAGANSGGLTFAAPGGAWGATTDRYTISMWAYESQDAVAARGLFQMGTPSWSLGLAHSVTTAGAFRASVVTTSGGAAQFNTGETPVYPAFAWHHVTVVWNPPSGLFLYVNGVQQASNTTATTTLRDVSDMRVFGNSNIAANGWDGSIADFRVYRRAFNAAEVWSLYDPGTRWDLYSVPSRRVYFDVGAAAFDPALFPRSYFADLQRRRDAMIPSGRIA